MKTISIIAPVFNEEKGVEIFYERVKKALRDLPYQHEIIFVDDGSTDSTLSRIRVIAREDKSVKCAVFSRNFGHQAAISAGLELCRGDAAVIIDTDLQDPPELIPQMVKKWEEGFEVVYAVRKRRKGEGFFKLAAAKLFYRLLNLISDIQIPLDTGDFRLIDRKVIDILKNLPEKSRFLRGLVSWIGFRQFALEYERDKRFAGATKYPFQKSLGFALDGIVSFSFVPLRLIFIIGMGISILTFVSALYIIWLHLFTDQTVTGWTSLMLTVLFLGGVQLISIGVIGEYLAKIFKEVKDRPLYLLKETISLKS